MVLLKTLIKIEHNYPHVYGNATATELLLNCIVVTPVLQVQQWIKKPQNLY